jgi:hypothetical protein
MRKLRLKLTDDRSVDMSKFTLLRDYRLVSFHFMKIQENVDFNYKRVQHLKFNNCEFSSINNFQFILSQCGKLDYLKIINPRLDETVPDVCVEESAILRTVDFFKLELCLCPDEPAVNDWQIIKIFTPMQLKFKVIALKLNFLDFSMEDENTEIMLKYMLEKYGANIKRICMYNPHDGAEFQKIIKFMQNTKSLKLDHLKIGILNDNLVFESFLEQQTELTLFWVEGGIPLTERQMKIVTQKLVNLSNLYVTFSSALDFQIFNQNSEQLSSLHSLRLDINEDSLCELKLPLNLKILTVYADSTSLNKIKFIFSTIMSKMEQLTLSGVNFENDELCQLFERMPNLKHLQLYTKHTKPETMCRQNDCADITSFSLASLKHLRILKLNDELISQQVQVEARKAGLQVLHCVNYIQQPREINLLEMPNQV